MSHRFLIVQANHNRSWARELLQSFLGKEFLARNVHASSCDASD